MVSVISSTFPAATMATMPQIDIEWAPSSAPLDAPAWTTIQARCRELHISRGRSTELEQYGAGKLSATFDNNDRLLDPNYTTGPWYAGVLPERQMRATARYNSITYDLINVFVDGFPQEYPAVGKDSIVRVEGTDGFKVLAATDLVDLYTASLRKDAPSHWYKLNDAEQASGLATRGQDYGFGTQTNGTWSVYPNGVKFGQAPIRIGNDACTQFNRVAFPTTDTRSSGVLSIPTSVYPASTTKFSFEIWFLYTKDASGRSFDLFRVGDGNTGIDVYMDETFVEGDVYTSGTNGLCQQLTAYNDGMPHYVAFTVDIGNTRARLYIDGVLKKSASPTGTVTFTGPDEAVVVSNTMAHKSSQIDAAAVSDFTIYDGVELTAAQVLDHYQAGYNAYAGEDTGTRAGRVLDLTAWPAARRTVSTGIVNVGAHDTGGRTALDYLQTLAQTERAEFYMESDGTVMWRNRNALATDSRSTASQATFGDSASETYHYSEIGTDYNEVQIRDDVTVTRDGGTPQRATDTPSIEKYLRHSHTETGTFDETDATALTKAQAILAKYKDPKLRITSIKILPGSDPTNLYPQVLGRKIGDRITVVRRPQSLGAAISQDCWIEGIEHDVTPSRWETTFRLVACS